jgi:hypothetical protein
MTVGYPDYGRSVQTTTLPLLQVSQNIKTSFTTPTTYIGDVGYIDFYYDLSTLSDFYEAGVNWWDDSAKTVFIGSSLITVQGNSTGGIQWKSLGRYFDGFIQADNGTDAGAFNGWWRGSNAQAQNQPNQLANNPPYYSVSVGAGANVIESPGEQFPGPAMWYVSHGSNATWHADIEFYRFGAKTWVACATAWGAQYGRSNVIPVILPAAPIRFNLHNDDTASQTMVTTLIQ